MAFNANHLHPETKNDTSQIRVLVQDMNTRESQELYARARRIIPGGTQTISKRPERYVEGRWPAYWDTAEGCTIRDIDGNTYVDYVLALGPILLGYNHPAVQEAVRRQLEKGPLATFQSPFEVEVAEKLIQHIPCAEMVRFFKTGAESTSAAVRIARAFTGREFVLSCGYAGCHDGWLAKESPSPGNRGVPRCLSEVIADVPLGDITALNHLAERHAADLACIVVEPKALPEMGEFLHECRTVADRYGAVCIFDEIVTGFRMGLGGAQGHFGVTPDLATFGKAMANGFPLAAVVGCRPVMETAGDLWLTSTFGGEALSLAAARAVLHELEATDALERIWAAGDRLLEGWRELQSGNERLHVYGLGPIPGLRFLDDSGELDERLDAAFVEQMFEQGILMRRNHPAFVTAAHNADVIERALDATAAVLGGPLSSVR